MYTYMSGFGTCVGYNRTSGVITGDRSCSPGLESLSEFLCRFIADSLCSVCEIVSTLR